MKGKTYAKEFKEMVLQEANENNDVAQVARRHKLIEINRTPRKTGTQ